MASDDNAKPEEDAPEAETPESGAAAERPESPEEPAEVGESEPERIAALVAALQAEKRELKEQLLRALAETENVRRRAQREREDSAKYAVAPLAKDLLSVCDNLRRAIESVSAEAAEADPQLKTLLEGVALTERGLMEAFGRHHIEAIEPLGEKLDPNLHHALFEVPDPDQPSGTVAQVIEVGYRLRDRLLREAKVGVYKGGPAAGAKPEPAPEAEAAAAEAPEPQEAPEAEQPASEDPGSSGNGAAKPGQRIDTAV